MVCNFLKLTDEMVKTILELDEGPLRWRQAPLKYLPPEWTEGLWQAIFNNTSRDFEGNPAYELYVRLSCNGQDPQQEASSKYYSASYHTQFSLGANGRQADTFQEWQSDTDDNQ